MLDLKNRNIILGSISPRRKQLMQLMDIPFSCVDSHYKESFGAHVSPEETVSNMAFGKNNAIISSCSDNDIVITADTIVCLNGTVMGKPKDVAGAKIMLKMLCGNCHTVVTGVCIADKKKKDIFTVNTDVWLKKLEDVEIDYYVNRYNPVDKAGAYGIQEWIGVVGIEKINGPYFNVMGLPTQLLYEHLKKFIDDRE